MSKIRNQWKAIKDQAPPEGVEVDTIVSDEVGLRNEQPMTFKNNLWWVGDMYVYYAPTHWRYLR